MIELLIVIAILGILAVAVLSAINPLEQIRRGRDTGSRSDTEQLVTALERFYASRGYFPWQTAEGDTTGFTSWAPSTSGDSSWTDLFNDLINAQEIKSSFTARISRSSANPIYLYYDGGNVGNSVYACFLPQSNSMKMQAAEECAPRTSQSDFPLDSACPGACTTGTWDGTDECMLCVP